MKKPVRTLLTKVMSIVTVLALLLSVAACGSPATSSQEQTTQTAATTASSDTTEAQPQAKPVTLKLITWSNQASVDAIKALNDKFTGKYPNITVEVTDVSSDQYNQLQQTRMSAGDVDIVSSAMFMLPSVDWAKGVEKQTWQQQIEAGQILDITDQPFVKNWSAAAIKNACMLDGKVYAISTGSVGVSGLFYNKNIFKQYGLEVPKTWSEFVNVCKTLQSNGVAPITTAGKDVWPLAMGFTGFISNETTDVAAYAKGFWTGSSKFTDDVYQKALTKFNEYASYMEKGFTGIDYNSVIGRFIAGKAAMLADGTWQSAQIQAADPNFQFGFFPVPSDNGESQINGKYDLLFEIFANTPNKEEALAWLDFLSQKENYTDFINTTKFLPTMDGVTTNNEFVNSLAPYIKDMKLVFDYQYYNPKGAGKYAGYHPELLKIAGGDCATPQILGERAQKDFDDAIKALGK